METGVVEVEGGFRVERCLVFKEGWACLMRDEQWEMGWVFCWSWEIPFS